MKKLITLSIILLVTLSASLLTELRGNSSAEEKVAPINQDEELMRQLKNFNAKDYIDDYERRKKEHKKIEEMLCKD